MGDAMDVDDKKEAPKAVAEAETKAEEAPLTPAQALAAAASLVVRAVQGKEVRGEQGGTGGDRAQA